MKQNHTNYSSQVNLESPIGKMPFGKFKDQVIWTLPLNQVSWMRQNLNLSERSKKTLDDAWDMFMKEGEYAVLRKFKDERWYIQLQGIFSTKVVADTHCNKTELYEDFVYHILAPKE